MIDFILIDQIGDVIELVGVPLGIWLLWDIRRRLKTQKIHHCIHVREIEE